MSPDPAATLPAVRASADLAHRPRGLLVEATIDAPPGYRVTRVLGVVRGNTIRARHVGHDVMAALKTIVGGEISEYTKMIAESREQALDRMRAEALSLGANGVVGVKFTTSAVMAGAAEILVYGTAVVVEEE